MIAARLQETWYGDAEPGMLLRGLEKAYAHLRDRDRKRQLAARAKDLVGKPIIVVGNLTVGGSGKTPLVIRLCELLRGAGCNVGVISRGHGRRSRAAMDVTAKTDPRDGGDEPVLIAIHCGVPVRVDADREAAARHLFEQGVEVVISDDGLQRERLPRALELCVVDAQRGFGNGHLLPAGPLREPLDRLGTVDWVVCNGEGRVEGLPADTVHMRLVAGGFRQVGGEGSLDAAAMAARLRHVTSHAVAGIANPGRFFGTLRQLGIGVNSERAFPDHHVFTTSDFRDLNGTVLMTGKDAVKCRGLGLPDAWYLPVRATLPADFEQAFMQRVVPRLETRP